MNNLAVSFFVFGLLWIAFSVLFSFVGGWREVARYYPYQGQMIDKKRHMQSGRLRGWMSYRNCLTVGANAEGLYLSMLFLFRPAHPPLFIPWTDITVERKTSFGFPVLEMRFNRVPSVRLTISQALETLFQSITGSIPYSSAVKEAVASKNSFPTGYQLVSFVTATLGVLAAFYAIFFSRRQ